MIETQIEINASPEEVRQVLFDFEKWPEWNSMVKSIKPLESGALAKGDKVRVNFPPTSDMTILENNARELKWRGDMFYVMSGEHYFIFEPSTTTPNGTTFKHGEEYFRLLVVLSKLFSSQMAAIYSQFNSDLKARVESLKADGAVSS